MREPSKETKFIRKHSKKPNAEIVELGKGVGLTLNPKTISVLKYNWKKAKEAAATTAGAATKPAVKASKKLGRASKPDPELVKLVLKRGVDRVAAALDYVRSSVVNQA